jgi:hypothetical protein
MRKVRVPINSFQYGEVSNSLIMRTDTAIYSQSAQRVENFIITPEGALKKRPGLKHIYDYNLTNSGKAQSHLFKFVFDDNEEYVVSLEDAKLRVFRLETDGTVSLATTLTTDVDSNPLPFDEDYLQEYTTAQYGDVMFICHPLIAPRTLTRTGLTTFEVATFTFDQRVDGNVTYQPYTRFQPQGVTLDPSATTGTGITLTTSEDYWQAGHVGCIVRYGISEVLITSITSATVAVGNVVDTLRIRLSVLNPLRTIDGSSTVEVTHIEHGFAGGETIVIEEASATGGINAGNLNGTRTVGAIIDENTYTFTAGGNASSAEDGGGYVKIVTHAPTTDWDEQSWSAVRGYPKAVVFHQNRLCFAGTLAEPDGVWMSKVGSFFNFYVDVAADDEAISLTAATGDVNEIRYMISNRDLQIFTASGELYVPTYLNQAITPTNTQIRKQTPFGCDHVQPVSIDGATLFTQIGGRIVREYLFTDREDAYTSTAVSTIASHLIDQPRCMTVAHSGFGLPDSFAVMTFSNGEAAAFSSNRAEQRAGWMRLTTNGTFCSVTAIKDRLFANVYDEYGKLQLCEFTGDYGLDFYLYKPIVSNIVDVSDLYTSGQIVDVLVTDGQRESYVGKYTVNASGEVDLSAYGGLGLTHAYVGKVFTAKIVTNPFDATTSTGPVTGEVRGIANVVVDMRNAWSMKVNNRNLVTDGAFSGKKEFRILGYSRDPQVTIEQQDPLPLQVNGIVAEVII